MFDMDLQRTIRYVGEIVVWASVAVIGTFGAAALLAKPPAPTTLPAWLLLAFTVAIVVAALILTFLLGLPLAQSGYPGVAPIWWTPT